MNPSTGGHLHITFCHPGLCHMGYFQVLSSSLSLSSSFSSLLFNPYWWHHHRIRHIMIMTNTTYDDHENERCQQGRMRQMRSLLLGNCGWATTAPGFILDPRLSSFQFQLLISLNDTRLPGRCLSSPSTSASLPMWSSALRRALRSITTPRGETNFKLILWRFTISCSELFFGSEERNPEYNNLFDEMMIGLNIWWSGDCDVKIVW